MRLIDATFEINHYMSIITNPTPDVNMYDKEHARAIVDAFRMAKTVKPCEPQWIPCSERLPEEGTEVLGTDDHGCIRHIVKDKSALYEFATYEEMMHINIVAWKPLPEPYEG